MNPYVEIFFVMACFAAFHSMSARPHIKSKLAGLLHINSLVYSFIRSLLSLSLLIFSIYLLFENATKTQKFFEPYSGLVAILPTMFAFWLAGMAFGQVAKSGRMPQFFGLKDEPKIFFFDKAYSVCRHPMYAGWLLASWGLILSKPYMLTIVYNILLTAFVIYESKQEEKRMVELFGGKYAVYMERTPFILPLGLFRKPRQE
jgi:protein-S-isoprenylcysteine O-methyltransferase Ste14